MKTFVSYSHQDEHWFEKLKIHIAPLLRNGTISIWSDHQILAGQPLDSEIKANLAIADLFLLILSPSYLASDYCMNVELAHAISRQHSNKVKIVPIIAESCKWNSIPDLKRLKIIPKDAKPISKWSDQNSAFVEVVEEIERLAEIESDKKAIEISINQNTSTMVNSLSKHNAEQKILINLRTQDIIERLEQGERNFNGVKIKDFELINYHLQEADFSRSDLSGAKLEGTNFEGANFVSANLESADLYATNMKGANLSAANLSSVSFMGANLNCANLWCCNIKFAHLEGADLEGANLVSADLSKANLLNSNLKCAILWHTILDATNLENVNLEGANLMLSKLRKAHLVNARLKYVNAMRADLKDAKFVNADLSFANLQNARLEGANFQGANLSYSNLMHTDFKNTNIEGANLTGVIR